MIQMRKKWNAYAKTAPNPPFTFQTLPSSNAILKDDHRDIYDRLWPEGTPQPVVCKCNLMHVYSLTAHFECKPSRRHSPTSAPAIPELAPRPHSRAPPVNARLADVMTLMRQSQDAQQSQIRQLVAAVAASQGRLALPDSPPPSERRKRWWRTVRLSSRTHSTHAAVGSLDLRRQYAPISTPIDVSACAASARVACRASQPSTLLPSSASRPGCNGMGA